MTQLGPTPYLLSEVHTYRDLPTLGVTNIDSTGE